MDTKQACIYCASSQHVDKKYFQSAELLTELLITKGYQIIYGGGSQGLMGAVADKALQMGGKVIGVIPEFMKEVEWDHPKVNPMIIVEDMAERKKRFLVDTDIVIALPGGCGTLEELVEVISLKKLGVKQMPILILNQDGFYDDLIKLFDKFIEQKFMGENHRGLFSVITEPGELLDAIKEAKDFSGYQVTDALVN